MNLTAVIRKEEEFYVAWCPEFDIASQGMEMDEAVSNLKEAIELYLEDEDAVLPESTPFLTTIEVGPHGKTSGALRT